MRPRPIEFSIQPPAKSTRSWLAGMRGQSVDARVIGGPDPKGHFTIEMAGHRLMARLSGTEIAPGDRLRLHIEGLREGLFRLILLSRSPGAGLLDARERISGDPNLPLIFRPEILRRFLAIIRSYQSPAGGGRPTQGGPAIGREERLEHAPAQSRLHNQSNDPGALMLQAVEACKQWVGDLSQLIYFGFQPGVDPDPADYRDPGEDGDASGRGETEGSNEQDLLLLAVNEQNPGQFLLRFGHQAGALYALITSSELEFGSVDCLISGENPVLLEPEFKMALESEFAEQGIGLKLALATPEVLRGYLHGGTEFVG